MDHCFVELPPGIRFALSANPDRIVVPASADDTHHYIHLRPDDVLNFSDYGLKVRIVLEVPESSQVTSGAEAIWGNTTPADEIALKEVEDDVQVKSSNVDDDDDDEETDIGEDDLDDVPEPDLTPAISRSTNGLAIKETPNAKRTVASSFADDDDAAPFSTAQDGGLSDDEESPLVSIDRGRLGETEAINSPSIGKETRDRSVQGLADAFAEQKKMKYTYGKRSSQATSRHVSPDAEELPLPDNRSDLGDITPLDENDQDDKPVNVVTSDPLGDTEIAQEVANRSLKRKAEAAVDDSGTEDDGATIVVSKKRKVVPPSEIASDETLKGDSPPTTTRKGRLRASRHSPTDSDNEVSAPARKTRKSSPHVVVHHKRDGTPASTTTSLGSTGKTPKVLLSKESSLRKTAANFLKDQGAEILDDVKTRRTNFVCVVKGDNVKTAKVLRSLVLGKYVVTEEWVQESKKAGQLLDPEDYIHSQFKDSINIDRQRLFNGRNLFFTTTLADKVYMSGWDDIVNIAKEAGASSVHKGNSGDYAGLLGRNAVLCFGAGNSDPDVHRLQSQHGCTVYHKSLITDAIFAGELDLDDQEFHLPAGNVRKQR